MKNSLKVVLKELNNLKGRLNTKLSEKNEQWKTKRMNSANCFDNLIQL